MSEHSGFTHLDEHGRARMVDVTAKPLTHRVALAKCTVVTSADIGHVFAQSPGGMNVVEAARVAGIQGAKQTATLIPLCHPIRIDRVAVDVTIGPDHIDVSAVTEIVERTGVEMEALTACSIAALTLVQALIASDPEASIEDLSLWHKSGGRSGDWVRASDDTTLTRTEPVTSGPSTE
ncbi:MAG TPA: cyclic pyranopterin monophosphate synthase MoaC [Acidimicrobiales bacterium]|jgi:cyclic pyranopterin phosphate synthase|nr:cyclic pyranopterin monophosphate synthase MoaC [Acidimicrobiales bacterium]